MADISFMIPIDDEKAQASLADVNTIYTDLDGTLLAPGGKLVTNFAGEPSTEIVEALVAVKRADIRLVVVTGRSRIQGNEFIRMLDADAFIGEMGTTLQLRDAGPLSVEYDTGTFEYDSERFATPHEAIEATGAVEALIARYPGRIERNFPRGLYRDVTHAMRGYLDVDEVNAFFAESGYDLAFEDNGMFFTTRGLELDPDLCPEIHGYHIVPANTSKALAVKRDMERNGLRREQTVSIGDGYGDVEMGRYTGAFVMMRNGLRNERNIAGASTLPCPVLLTNGICCDGWVEFARTLLAKMGQRSPGALSHF